MEFLFVFMLACLVMFIISNLIEMKDFLVFKDVYKNIDSFKENEEFYQITGTKQWESGKIQINRFPSASSNYEIVVFDHPKMSIASNAFGMMSPFVLFYQRKIVKKLEERENVE